MGHHPHQDDFGFSLIQNHGDRALQLEKMRAKLASQSLGLRMPPKPKQRLLSAALTRPIPISGASVWAGRVLMVIALAVGNGVWLASRHEAKAAHAARGIPRLKVPAPVLDPDRQALYWAYALYDFDKLTAEFGVPKGALVDCAEARRNLMDLLPRVGAPTRLAIEAYLPKPKAAP